MHQLSHDFFLLKKPSTITFLLILITFLIIVFDVLKVFFKLSRKNPDFLFFPLPSKPGSMKNDHLILIYFKFLFLCKNIFLELVHRVRPRFFDQVGHETMHASSENNHFFTKSCHCQTYRNYEQPPLTS